MNKELQIACDKLRKILKLYGCDCQKGQEEYVYKNFDFRSYIMSLPALKRMDALSKSEKLGKAWLYYIYIRDTDLREKEMLESTTKFRKILSDICGYECTDINTLFTKLMDIPNILKTLETTQLCELILAKKGYENSVQINSFSGFLNERGFRN